MRLATKLTPRARQELERAVTFWRSERPAAPDLLLDELEAALEVIAEAPHLGVAYVGGRPGTRRTLLTQTRMHVYYAVRAGAVVVLSVWSAVRRRGPRV